MQGITCLVILLLTAATLEAGFLTQTELKDTIAEAKMNTEAKESIARDQIEEKRGKDPTAFDLAKKFRRPSVRATLKAKARLEFEDMVRIAEEKIFAKRGSESPDAEGSHHTTGDLLSSEELQLLNDNTGCRSATPSRDCAKEMNVNIYRTIDGVCNNMKNPTYGATTTPFRRLLGAEYEDKVSQPRGYKQAIVNCTHQSIQTVNHCGLETHNSLLADPEDCINFKPPIPSARYASWQIILDVEHNEFPYTHLLMQFAQFVDHDINIGPDISEDAAPNCTGCDFTDVCDPIRVSDNDKYFGLGTLRNASCLPLRRTASECVYNPPSPMPPREQLNDVTAYFDGSTVYASTRKEAERLRTMKDGLLKSSDPLFQGGKEILPYDNCTKNECDYVMCMSRKPCFLCGDVRCNDQTAITILHTIWLRQHNRIAGLLKKLNPDWDDEIIYQETRKIVSSMIQKIAYLDYLPKVLSQEYYDMLMGRYDPENSYNDSVDPQVTAAFDSAAYRYGHSLIRPTFARLGSDYKPIMSDLNLVDMFFNPPQLNMSGGTDPLLRGMLTNDSLRVDEYINFYITTQLFKPPDNKTSGMDLASLNLQRAREHGLPPYPMWKSYCESKFPSLPVAKFSRQSTVDNINRVYGSDTSLDLFIGGLAETRLPGALVGPTFACLFALTFKNIRDGDRFYFEKSTTFTKEQVSQIYSTTLSRVICDNADNITVVPPDAFLSDKPHVSCSALPAFNVTPWRESTSFLKVSGPENILQHGKIISAGVRRDGESPLRIYTNTRSSSCLPLPRPTDTAPVAAYVVPNLRDLNSCTVSSAIAHESVQDESASFFWSDIPKDVLYDSLDECKAAKTASITWTCLKDARLKDGVIIDDIGDAQPSASINSPDSMTTAPPSLPIKMKQFLN